MAGPWENYQAPSAPLQPVEQAGPWAAYAPPAPKQEPYKGGILPFSKDAEGNVSFDSDAGIVGAIKRAVTLPGDVATGKVDPMSDEALERSVDMAGFSSMSPAAGIARKVLPKTPTTEELYKAADTGYDAVRATGAEYKASSISDVAGRAKFDLEADGILAELAPRTHFVLGKLQETPPGAVGHIKGLEAARRAFGAVAKDFNNPTEQAAAIRAQRQLDEFISSPPEGSVLAGGADEASRLLTEARGNYAAAKRSDKLQGVEEAADLRSSAANSGQNYDNAVRQRVASLLLNPKARAGFTDDELVQLEAIVRGSPANNAVRGVGNLLGGGGGLGSVVTAGAGALAGSATGSPALTAAGAALPVLGNVAKRGANAMNERAFSQIEEGTRMRSPLYESLFAGAPTEMAIPEGRAAALRALLLAQQNGEIQ